MHLRHAGFLLLALAFAWPLAALAQSAKPAARAPAGKPAPARQVDDRRYAELATQAEGAYQRGDFAAAQSAAAQAIDEGLRAYAGEHANLGRALNVLGAALLRQGKYPEAEVQFRRMLALYEKHVGPDDVYTAAALNSLALVLERLSDYRGAETLLRRSLAILEAKQGKQHPDTATTLSNLSRVLDAQGRFSDAGARPGAAPAPAPAAAAAGGADAAAQLAARASAALQRGEYQESETLQAQVLAVHEKSLGAEHPTTATSLSNLGNVYYLQGKFAEAEKVYRRALGVREKVLGGNHPDVATSLNNLANVQQELGRDQQISASEARIRARTGSSVGATSEIDGLYRRALAIQSASLGRDHPDTAKTLNNLGITLSLRGEFAQAEEMHRSALSTMEKVFGEQHPDTAATLTSLSFALDRQGKVAEAEASYLRAVEISRKAGNPRELLVNASRLGFSLAKRGRYREALPFYKESVETLDFLYSQTRGYTEETRATFLSQFSAIYRETIRILLQLHKIDGKGGFDREALSVASRNQSRVFTEMMRQADVARFSGEPAFIALRASRERLQEQLAQLRQARATVPVTLADAAQRVAGYDAQIAAAGRELSGAEDRLWREYPRFMELANPRPVGVEDLQARLLRPDEALVSYVLLPQETVIFVVTKERFRMAVTSTRRADIAERVHRVRRSIEKVAIGESVLFLREITPDLLHSLHRDLIAPVSDLFAGKERVFIVGDGPLHTVPFEMFVTRYTAAERNAFEQAQRAADGSEARPFLAEYGALAWLGAQHRFAYLPSLSALTSQRLYPKGSPGSSVELVAFADPVFTAAPGLAMPAATSRALSQLNVSFSRAGGAPEIPRLAETADEAREIAGVLGGQSRLYIGNEAQESAAKLNDLRAARFVLFATHGFLGGEFVASDLPQEEGEGGRRASVRREAQPSLALTLVGDLKGEDGLLTMKEVIEDVELNAELVALSACNTAGESVQANNGEGFAGLTRAFMYAGAKALLVSHWSVDSKSTQALMTDTFRNIKQGMPTLTAISTAQKTLLSGRYTSGAYSFSRAHPFFWAPFVLVGE
ncbi:MAG: tetratricopeptide repeat protein [Betaproteobacteria bacterium]|nr:tetratricopeptide repeat protein [Betaproteobacteria bacterium]